MPGARVIGVVPLHNHARWVNDAIDSVDRQDHEDKVVVVVDDGSTDGGADRVRGRLKSVRDARVDGLPHDPAAFVGRHPNCGTEVWVLRFAEARGPSFARNRGMEFGSALGGSFYALLDSDDVYGQGKISKSVEALSDPAVGAAYSDYDTLRPDGLRVREFKEPFSRERLVRECIVNCDSVVSAEAMKAVGGFDESMRVAEDYDLWVRMSERFMIVHLPESLVTIRVGGHSSSSTVGKEVWERCWRRVMEKARQRAHA